ncbi:hypothetical protein ACIBFB_18685 [Nocardiopsis sp. NPDC050513]|uniref:hypothetical protein n=1 Tax=Nocardiopsis sp. NPDC050513 TaxID=3364338 RepID=UPI0037884525
MAFHPPTFEPGPVATAIGVALIVCLVLQPFAFRPLYAATRRPVPPEGSSPLVRLQRATAWWSLAQVFAGMLFIGTATGVTPADIGVSPPAFHGFGDGLFVPFATVVGVVFPAVFLVLVAKQAWGLRRTDGTLPPNVQARMPRATLALLPRNVAERRAVALGSLASVLGTTVSVYCVLMPLFLGGFGIPPLGGLAFVFLLTLWGGSDTGWGNSGSMALLEATAAAWYLFVLVGSLVAPLLIWGLVLAVSLAAMPYRGPDADPEPAPDAPAMTWRPDDGAATPDPRP